MRIATEYFPFPAIYHDSPDALIVTGSNPIELDIHDEPYWGDLVELLTWSRSRVRSTLLSCLSAHAALVVFDGASRQRLSEKCTGVYAQHVERDRSLTEGLDAECSFQCRAGTALPTNLSKRPATTSFLARRQRDGALRHESRAAPDVSDPGAPGIRSVEFVARVSTRRRALRSRRAFRSTSLPYHCVSPDDWEALVRFHHDVVLGARDVQAFEALPVDELGSRAPWPWHSPAVTLFTNWVASVVQEGDR